MNRPKNSRFRKFLQDFGNFWNVQINLDLKHLHFCPIHHRIWSFLDKMTVLYEKELYRQNYRYKLAFFTDRAKLNQWKVKAAQANASKAKPKLKAAVAQNNHAPSSVSHQFEDPAIVEERNRLANMPPPPPPPQFQQPQVKFITFLKIVFSVTYFW